MGAFVLASTREGQAAEHANAALRKAVAEMQRRQMQQTRVFEGDGFKLHVYRKRRFDTRNYLEFANGDFIVAVGTLIYSGQYGEPALQGLYQDLRDGRLSLEKGIGHFGVVASIGGKLTVFNDYRGMCMLFGNADRTIISTSFLAVYASLETFTPNSQDIYEYLTFSFNVGHQTPLAEIDRLDRRQIYEIGPSLKTHPKPVSLPDLYAGDDFDRHVDQAHGLLQQYFEKLVSAFGDDISIGLTGGYDSRLMLAYLRAAGCNPRVYVQGPEDHEDVIAAKKVAAFVGFDLHHEELDVAFEASELQQRLVIGCRYVDGLCQQGLFDKSPLNSQARERVERPEKLRLYGMAGEIFRRRQEVPDRLCTLQEFFAVQADKFDASAYTTQFSRSKLFAGVGAKMIDEMGLTDGMLTPTDADAAYPEFRMPGITGTQLTNENERAHALVPFTEPVLTECSRAIPMKYRDLGELNAKLIERADARLAAAPTNYGHPFTEPPSLKRHLRRRMIRSIPVSVRPLIHRTKKRLKGKPQLPNYLQAESLESIFPDGISHVTDYVDLGRVTNPEVLSRALTIELMLTGRLNFGADDA